MHAFRWRQVRFVCSHDSLGFASMKQLLILLLLASPAFAQTTQIKNLTPINASDIANDAAVHFGVDKTDIPATRRISLAELKKTGVQVVNVKQYGAVGDGVTDDTAELQQAIDASGDVAPLFLPRGNYLVSDRLYFDDKEYIIVGHDATITIDPASTQLNDFSFLQNRNNTTPVDSFIMRGIRIVDQGDAAAEWKALVRLEKCGYALIEDCEFDEISTTGIQIGSLALSMAGGTNGPVIIQRCRVGCSSGTHVSAVFAKIEYAPQLTITDNVISDCARPISLELSANLGMSSVVIAKNHLSDCAVSSKSTTNTAIPIHVNAQAAGSFIDRLVVTDNTISNSDYSGSTSQGFDIMVSGAADGQVTAATIANNISTGCKLTGKENASYVMYLKNLANSTVTGNVFEGVAYTDIFAATADDSTDVVTATGHNFTDTTPIVFTTTGTLPAPLAISTVYYVRDSAANTFKVAATSGGAAIDITTTGTGTLNVNPVYRGIVVDSCTQMILSGNVLAGDFDRGIHVNATTYSILQGNLFNGTFSSGGEIVPSSATGTVYHGNYAAGLEVN